MVTMIGVGERSGTAEEVGDLIWAAWKRCA
jgi:hypothetical protein